MVRNCMWQHNVALHGFLFVNNNIYDNPRVIETINIFNAIIINIFYILFQVNIYFVMLHIWAFELHEKCKEAT